MYAFTYECKADTRPLASRVVNSLVEDPDNKIEKSREHQSLSEESSFMINFFFDFFNPYDFL